ncbi:hypothetical protein V6Z11_A09G021400 [Gossypium hirsutum]
MGFQLALYFALLLLILFLLCPILQAAESQEPACGEEVCGNITISSPFGSHSSCYTYSWLRVTSNQTQNGKKPFINVNGIDLEVLGSLYSNGILIRNPVAYINCDHTNEASVSVNLSGTPFFFSSERNYFGSVGCGNLATILSNEADSLGGCIQSRCDDDGASESGCITYITVNLTSYTVNMTAMYPDSNRCASAFIYSPHRLLSGINIGTTHVPAVLNWKSSNCGDTGCERPRLGRINFKPYMIEACGNYVTFHYPFRMKDQDNPNDWFKVNCRKTANGQKLPFLTINGMNLQILDFDYLYGTVVGTPIYGVCYLNDSLDTSCTSDDEYCWSRLSSNHLCCSTSVGTLFLLLATWSMYKVLKRKQKFTLKQKYFKRNGGLLLQQHLSSNEGNVDKIKLFTSKEMEKATNYYNENRILGQGGQGTVYKGMLIDGSIVAIKKSKMVEGMKFDEKKVEQFINEVIILSQINHRNVVKLLGCCLEAEVPLLVYEFIPNGTLYDLIHNQNEELPLTWEMRLRIAIEIANALFYLHSAASAPIYHRDIKSSNILLDDKYRAKVSDFGTSRSVALEQTHLTTRVQGTFGYMDPEYFRSSQFTEKSDVYSFGVVLIELLTGQKPISAEQSEPVRSLVSYFLHSMQENSLFNILDPMVVKVGPKQEIIVLALLAKRCLNLNGKKRPTMKKVAMELELIKASGGNVIEDHGDEESEIDDIIHSWETNPSCSMSCDNYIFKNN